MRAAMPRLNIDSSKIEDKAVIQAFDSVQDHADSNPFSSLDGKLIKFNIKTSTTGEAITLFHGLDYTPNIAFSVGLIGQDYVGTTFTPVVSDTNTNDRFLKIIVSDPCIAEVIMFVGRDSQRRK
jgi:hypothetical protein